MANEKKRKLTEAETQALGPEYQLLATKLETQTIEQIVFLRKHIARDTNISQAKRNALDQIVEQGGFKLILFRVTDANALEKNQVQVTYDIHDELYEYLATPAKLLPRELRGFLDGGSIIDPGTNKPTAEDPTPLTGKTKTGVPRYDAILNAQRGKN